MGMKDIYADFKETKEKYDGRYSELEQRSESLKLELRSLRVQHDEKLYAEEAGGNIFTLEERDTLKKQMRDIGDELEEIETRRDFNRKGRKQALLELIPGVKASGEKKRDELIKKHAKQAEDVRRKAAEYLLSLQELHQIEEDIKTGNVEFAKIAEEVGSSEAIPGIEKVRLFQIELGGFVGGQSIPNRAVSGIYGIMEREVTAAYTQGTVPAWVTGYRKSGFIVPIDAKEFIN